MIYNFCICLHQGYWSVVFLIWFLVSRQGKSHRMIWEDASLPSIYFINDWVELNNEAIWTWSFLCREVLNHKLNLKLDTVLFRLSVFLREQLVSFTQNLVYVPYFSPPRLSHHSLPTLLLDHKFNPRKPRGCVQLRSRSFHFEHTERFFLSYAVWGIFLSLILVLIIMFVFLFHSFM